MQRIWRQTPAPSSHSQSYIAPSPPKYQPLVHLSQPIDVGPTGPMEEDELFRDNFDEVADIARKSYKLVKYVMGELNVEHKVIQGIASSVTPDDSGISLGSSILANSCAQGTLDSQRTGDSIKISNFYIRGTVQNVNAVLAVNDIQWIRLLVTWQSKQDVQQYLFPSLAGPYGNQDGLLDTPFSGTALATISPKAYDSDAASEILLDETFSIDFQHPSHQFKHLIRLDRKTQFIEAQSGIDTGVLRIMVLGTQPAATASKPTIHYVWRTYFVDN